MIRYNGVLVTRDNVHTFPLYIVKAFKLEAMQTLYDNGWTTDIIQAWSDAFDLKYGHRSNISVRVPEDILLRLRS